LFLTYDLSYDHPVIGSQSAGLEVNERSFDAELADARTFGFVQDLPMLQSMGLAKGSSIENTLVFSQDGYNNKPRWEDEPVRHKLVDALGDLYLLGYRINGCFSGYRSGHALNHALARMVINDPENWTLE
jgi:UDP-3-O-[3-hydroxymyristoyl] N-acetylglucosamine deacetylase